MTKPYECTIYGHRYTIRTDMIAALDRYVDYGAPVGGFLHSILTHDLYNALGAADDDNFYNIQAYANYLYNEIPGSCHGSKEKVDAWISRGGHKGRNANEY